VRIAHTPLCDGAHKTSRHSGGSACRGEAEVGEDRVALPVGDEVVTLPGAKTREKRDGRLSPRGTRPWSASVGGIVRRRFPASSPPSGRAARLPPSPGDRATTTVRSTGGSCPLENPADLLHQWYLPGRLGPPIPERVRVVRCTGPGRALVASCAGFSSASGAATERTPGGVASEPAVESRGTEQGTAKTTTAEANLC
jgi:hypothetical protein